MILVLKYTVCKYTVYHRMPVHGLYVLVYKYTVYHCMPEHGLYVRLCSVSCHLSEKDNG